MGIHTAGEFVAFEKAEIEQSIPNRFERMAAQYPDRLAVKTATHELTYAELNARANGVARSILALSGRAAEAVALLFDQGAPLIAAILGVLKAGKIYVPLDPSYPRARNTHMLAHSQAATVVADEKHVTLAADLAGERCRVFNAGRVAPAAREENLGLPLSPDALAYIFYTSGSTGEPKGVVDNHRNVLHNIMRYTNGLLISAGDRLALLQSCSFSGSVSSLFSALLNGAAVFPFDPRTEPITDLAGWLNEQRITVYHSVPILFRQMLSEGGYFPHVRVIRLEGDQASLKDVSLYKKHFSPECVLVNGLGATETGIVRRYFLGRDTEIAGGILPVGHAVEDMDVLLLDDEGVPAGHDQVGEIAVKSRYLAVGYWRNPELTQARFQTCPEGDGLRLYRTGDLGRMRADGCLEHLGRKDFQVKIRGYRVELAEIEAALYRMAEIKEAAVTAVDDTGGEKRLVAYLVPADKQALGVRTLRDLLAELLPDYMIPSAYVTVESLPLNPNGKVDRRALPAPDGQRPDLDTTFVPPRTPTEAAIAAIWAEVLGLDRVGVRDNFVDLGGHSLTATQITSRIRDTFEVTVPVGIFMAAATVESQAAIIARSHEAGAIP